MGLPGASQAPSMPLALPPFLFPPFFPSFFFFLIFLASFLLCVVDTWYCVSGIQHSDQYFIQILFPIIRHWIEFLALYRKSLLLFCLLYAWVLSHFSHIWLFVTPWTVAHQAFLSMGFSRQESWSGLPLSSPGHLLHPGIEPGSLALPADSLPSQPPD